MIQAYIDDLLIIGITKGNIDRLMDGKPMLINLVKNVNKIYVVYGVDKTSIIEQLEKAGGPKFEESHKAAARENPE